MAPLCAAAQGSLNLTPLVRCPNRCATYCGWIGAHCARRLDRRTLRVVAGGDKCIRLASDGRVACNRTRE